MGMNRLALLACLAALTTAQARAEDTDVNRAERWQGVAHAIFGGKPIAEATGVLQIDAPPRALDASLVPVTVTVAPGTRITGLTLIIDDNPAPVAAKFRFGPLADAHLLKTRVRVDQYTLIHAVAELPDGSLVSASRFIKAAGGCSAPGTTDQTVALERLGRMRMRFEPASSGAAVTASLLISHPNFNGMQMNPVTRLYTPARYVQTVTVTEAGQGIFTMEGDISLAEDPSITFAFHPDSHAPLDVEVEDSAKAVFHQSFPLDAHAS